LSARNHPRHFAFLTYDYLGRLNVTFDLT